MTVFVDCFPIAAPIARDNGDTGVLSFPMSNGSVKLFLPYPVALAMAQSYAVAADGLAVIKVSQLDAMLSLFTDLRDFRPEVIKGSRINPQDDIPDMIQAGDLYQFQEEAGALLSKMEAKE